jgi:hypothetical protein
VSNAGQAAESMDNAHKRSISHLRSDNNSPTETQKGADADTPCDIALYASDNGLWRSKGPYEETAEACTQHKSDVALDRPSAGSGGVRAGKTVAHAVVAQQRAVDGREGVHVVASGGRTDEYKHTRNNTSYCCSIAAPLSSCKLMALQFARASARTRFDLPPFP